MITKALDTSGDPMQDMITILTIHMKGIQVNREDKYIKA
jgi:hypothetical protein